MNPSDNNAAARTRLYALISILVIVPAGFFTKFYSGPARDWVNNSLGGVFYEIFWCLVLFICFRSLRPRAIAITVLIATCVLEFLQLWHPPFLEMLRSNFIGSTLLGTTFSISDFPYYVAGSGIGWLLMCGLLRRAEGRCR